MRRRSGWPGAEIRDNDLRGRTDFRPLVTVTIDGEHARDFDDAITIEKLANGNFWLGVHIADVAHYVAEGSALDEEAYERATSVYFPDRAVHMFPSELSTGLCSLNPDVDRLVQTCLMEVDRKGTVLRYEMHDGVIHSNARMTYTDVNAILTDRDPDVVARYRELVPLFEMMHDLFGILNKRRHRRGSIDFDLKEPEIVLDDEGMVEAIIAAERNVAHRIIEEFMLLANETVAEHLDTQNVPTLYRIHEDPDPMKVAEFEEFIATLGYTLNAAPDGVKPRDFQRLVEKMRGTPEEKPIAFLMLRTMQKARYDPQNLGHFGLAAKSYTHFTSPIRRYPGPRRPSHAPRVAARADGRGPAGRADRRPARDRTPHLGARAPRRRRRAGAGPVEEGPLHGGQGRRRVRGLHHRRRRLRAVHRADRAFRRGAGAHLDDGGRLLPVRRARAYPERREHRQVYRLGDKVTVQVIKVDMERRQVDLGLVEILERVREQQNRGPRRSRAGQGPRPGAAGKGAAPAPRKPKRDTKARTQRPGRKNAPQRRRG